MPDLRRFGISIEAELSDRFDAYLAEKGCPNRSEGIRDLVRDVLVGEEWAENTEVAGCISLVYDHHRRELLTRLMDLQHDDHDLVLASQHVHIEHDTCLEVLIVRGRANRIRAFFHKLQALKGIKHVAISRTSLGQHL
jgi:CopG family nickel-responsive transcriptional regulator